MTRRAIVACGLLLACVPLATHGEAPAIVVGGAYVPAAPPRAGVAAAYFDLRNDGAQVAEIVGAKGACAPTIGIHRTIERGGIARMLPVSSLSVGPGETLRFEEGGLHVMLHGFDLQSGDTCSFSLQLASGAAVPILAPVRARQALSKAPHIHSSQGVAP